MNGLLIRLRGFIRRSASSFRAKDYRLLKNRVNMERVEILKRLQELFTIRELTEGFPDQQSAISWSNKVAPLLQLVSSQYYLNFIQNSHMLNLNLSSYSIIPALNIMKSQMEMAIEELKLKVELEKGLPDQMYFSEKSYLDIQKNLARVLRQATKRLWIYDPYMDEKIIEELADILANEIYLLTDRPKPLFSQRLAALKQQFPNKKIESKTSDKSHDRFFIIDDAQVWTLGASYNKAGQKATLLSKITNPIERDKIIKDFKDWWQSATI